jgi:filamentous hemagglutinin family protein
LEALAVTKFSLLSQGWQLKLVGSVAIVGTLFTAVGESVLAQIVPDNTLGAEGSVVTPNVNIQGILSDLIDGGATRGANLFHSFSELNVGEGRGAYFANPIGIENILTRVTGGNPSNIFGRLGVLGGANLFLLNPNGIVFGANSSVDIQGSLVVATAERIQLGDSGYFSATQPQTSSLLSVSPGALFFNAIANQPTSIINRGNLSTGKHLTLSAGNLDLQGQLQAGGDLTLQAQDTVKVRDTIASPFIATSGRNLTLQGNHSVDILALNHPQSKIQSGGNLSLVSDGDISGDAHFFSGGSLSMLTLAGTPVNFVSWFDPIIYANGDVLFGNYTGVALKVEATGSIQGGNIRITGAECAAGSPGCVGGIPTTDPDFATLTTRPSVILRAGLASVNTPSIPQNAGGTNFTATLGLPLGISVGDIDTSDSSGGNGGNIILSAAKGSITTGVLRSFSRSDVGNAGQGGAISLTATNDINITGDSYAYSLSFSGNAGQGGMISISTTNGSINTGNLSSDSCSDSGSTGNGGAIRLEAANDITIAGDVNSSSKAVNNADQGGAISLTAANDINLTGNLDSFSYSAQGNAGEGGAISLTTTNDINLTGDSYAYSLSSSGNAGQGGAISLTATNDINITGDSYAYSLSFSGNAGQGGMISISTTNGSINTGNLSSDSRSDSGSTGNGGAIRLEAANDITTKTLNTSTDLGSAGDISLISRNGGINTTGELDAYSKFINAGNGGRITLQAEDNITTVGMRSDGGTFGVSGDITITSETGTILVDDGEINSKNYGTLKGGDINITAIAGSIFLRNGTRLNASTERQGNAGNVIINATDTVSFDDSGAFSSVERGAEGNGGDINITTGSLSVTNGARLNAGTSGQGNGGKVIVNARERVFFDGFNGLPTAALSNVEPGAKGNSGGVSITTSSLLVTNGALLESRTRGQGNGGSVNINATDTVSFDDSGAFSSVERGAEGNGGDINITTRSLFVTEGAQLFSSTFGQGNGGTIKIQAEQLFMSSNAALITDVSTGGQGQAGDINLAVSGTIALTGGETAPTGESTRITLGVQPDGVGSGGNLYIRASSLVLRDGGIIKNSTQGQGNAGNIHINAEVADISGSVPSSGLPSGLFTSTDTISSAGNITIDSRTFRIADGAALSARSKGDGQGGNIRVNTSSFEAVNGGQLITTTFGRGQAGNIFVHATDRVTISSSAPNYTNRIAQFPKPISPLVANAITETGPNSGLFANTETNSTGNGGNIEIVTSNLNLTDSAQISASTSGRGRGGNLTINTGNLTATNGTIATSSQQSTGGDITITADRIRLFGDSDITTSVNQGAGGGGNIYLKAGSILAFDDSDILAFARDGRGGDVTLNTPAFFGENYRPAPPNTNPDRLENNNQVDINASGAVSGIITTPDTTFIQNSLTELPNNQIDTDRLLANSCIVRRNEPTRGSFFITGTGGLPQRPGDAQISTFPTVDIETLPSDGTPSNTQPNRPWQKGDPIVEPQGVYRLPNGKLVLSRECS